MQNEGIKYQWLKRGIMSLFLLIAVALVSQQYWEWSTEKPLSGAFSYKPEPAELTMNNWSKGIYQSRMVRYLDKAVGFRTDMVRMNNSIDFYMFGRSPVHHLRIGSEGWLYTNEYIKAYAGKDFIGNDSVAYRTAYLEKFSNHLKQKGKKLLVVIAPNKARVYPEHLGRFNPEVLSDSTNYGAFKQSLAEADIPVLDFNYLFMQWKDTAAYPIIPREGTHWSYYSTRHVFDTLYSFWESQLNVDLPEYRWSRQNVLPEANDSDRDLFLMMNLAWNTHYPDSFAYPILERTDTLGKDRPKLITIGDSFFWLIRQQGLDPIFFDRRSAFAYYFNTIYIPREGTTPRIEANWPKMVEESDVVMILCGESTMHSFPYGLEDAIKEDLGPIPGY